MGLLFCVLPYSLDFMFKTGLSFSACGPQYLLVFCCVSHLKLSSPGVEGGCVGLDGVGWSLIGQKMGLSLEDGVREQPHPGRKLD